MLRALGILGSLRIQGSVLWHLMDAALAPLRQHGVQVLNYLDCWLICVASKDLCRHHVALLLAHIQDLGLQ